MLVRGFLLSTLLFAVFCVSTLDATKKCNNFQLEKSVKNGEGKSGECSACTGYICKVGGKNIFGSACTEDVKEICEQSWDESKLESIAAEKKYQSEKGKYFVFSCQEDSCNSVQWITEAATVQYAKEIAASDLSFDDGSTRGQRKKREKVEVYTIGSTTYTCKNMTEEIRKDLQKKFDDGKMSPLIDPIQVKFIVCEDGIGENAGKGASDTPTSGVGNNAGKGASDTPTSDVEKIGFGIGLILAILGYVFLY